MIDERKQNQKKIDELQTQLTEMKIRNGLLQNEFNRIEYAAKYQQQLNEMIRQDSNVYQEWLSFLEQAGIEEPEWKMDYIPSEYLTWTPFETENKNDDA